jgi:hypothetical protein
MGVERKPGSNLGRAAVDWPQAFHYYASLPADRRSYRTVAAHYKVSVRTVEKHGLRDQWKERAREIDREAAAAAAATLATDRARKLVDLEKLIDESEVRYAQTLRSGEVRISAADLPRLHKLRKELWDDLDAEPVEPATAPVADQEADPSERKLQVLRALRDAGALERVHELVDGPADTTPQRDDDDRNDGATRVTQNARNDVHAEPPESSR